jgi:MFS family permease
MSPIARTLLVTRGLRAFGDGFVALLLPLYLTRLGYDALHVGLLTAATLAGSAALTLAVGLTAHRIDAKRLLVGASVLMIATGLCFSGLRQFWPLLAVGFVGTINPTSGDVSLFLPLEQSLLAHAGPDAQRTSLFARYSLVGSLVGAAGALAAGGPDLLKHVFGLDPAVAIRLAFLAYGLFGVVNLILYRGLPAGIAEVGGPRTPLGPSRRNVLLLAGLFSIDSFGSGFFVQSLLALWLFTHFGLSVTAAGAFFFWSGVLGAFSFLAAARIAKRIGLINTMVFTHIPASLCLMAVPFTPSLPLVMALLLVRAALAQMDVPARTSYVMAIVTPPERAAAASLTVVPRGIAAAIGPVIAGWLMTVSVFAWPLLIGGGLKIAYDLLLLFMFRNVRPPEELDRPPPAP